MRALAQWRLDAQVELADEVRPRQRQPLGLPALRGAVELFDLASDPRHERAKPAACWLDCVPVHFDIGFHDARSPLDPHAAKSK
jgi:hypothetical protein